MEEAVVMEAEVEDTEEVGMAGDMVIILTNVIYFKYNSFLLNKFFNGRLKFCFN